MTPKEKELREKLDELCKPLTGDMELVNTYDKERWRGLVHTEEWHKKMQTLRQLNNERIIQRNALWEEIKQVSEPYDPDNHIGSCGCIVKNGERVKWCGDHF